MQMRAWLPGECVRARSDAFSAMARAGAQGGVGENCSHLLGGVRAHPLSSAFSALLTTAGMPVHA
jgi:hypothetical protein